MSAQLQVIYKDQFIEGFELRQSILRQAVTTDTESRGGQVYFLVADSGAAVAVTRGSNGLIPAVDDNQVQVPITFAEAHHLIRRTGFDIFKAQSNQLMIMQNAGMATINRKIDRIILDAAETGTVTLGAIGVFNKTVANQIATKLANAHADEETSGNMYGLLSPAAWSYATDITSFANSLYSKTGGNVQDGIPQMGKWVYWEGIYWTRHTGLTGNATSACTCLAWHRAAIGHAIASGTIDAVIDRNREQDYSYSRHSVYQGSAKLQNAGIVKFVHDDSALS
jgi:hypothetical protein